MATVKLTHHSSARIVALSEDMRERLVAQGAAPERVRVIHNWAIGDEIQPADRANNRFRLELGLGDRFVIMYSGNLGVGHEFGTFLGAARELARRKLEVEFVFIGDGARRAEAEDAAQGLTNVRFLPYQPKERLPETLSAADAHLISLRDGLEGLIVPSKLYGALATGRPVFYVGPPGSEVARVVRESELGWSGPIGAVERLSDALAHAATNLEWRSRTGANARRAYATLYHRSSAVRKWSQVLEDASRL